LGDGVLLTLPHTYLMGSYRCNEGNIVFPLSILLSLFYADKLLTEISREVSSFYSYSICQ
jgi:hypothetical protein